MKPKQPRVALFLAQPAGTLVGEGKPFKNIGDLCRHAHEVWGYEAVTAPAGGDFLDIDKVLKSKQYPADLLGQYESWGTPLIRLEAHTDGQLMCVHPAQLPRYAGFAPDVLPDALVWEHQRAASKRMRKIVKASHILGFHNLVTFSGNKGFTVGKHPWSAYPKDFRKTILLTILHLWKDVFAEASDYKIKIGMELHPEEDIHSPILLLYLHRLASQVASETAYAIAGNADASHPTMHASNAADNFEFLYEYDLLAMCHLKDAELLRGNTPWVKGGTSMGDFRKVWSQSFSRFCTFGFGDSDWSRIIPILLAAHKASEHGVDFVVEGECSRFPNMMQALGLAAENARLARAGKKLVTKARAESGGDNWEEFCTNDKLKAEDLLGLTPAERRGVSYLRNQITNETMFDYI